MKSGQTPGFPRFQGRNRYHSFTYNAFGNGAQLDNGFLVLSTIGRMAMRWSRPLEGTPKTVTISHEADGWYVVFSCAEVPAKPLPPTGKETGKETGKRQGTGIDGGSTVFLITAQGLVIDNPRHHRHAEKQRATAQRRVSRREQGSHRRRKAVGQLRRAHQTGQRQRADFHHKTALALLRDYDAISLADVRVANLVRNRHLAKSTSRSPSRTRAGRRFAPALTPRQPAPGVELWRSPRSTPARTVAAVGNACPRV